VGLSSELCHFFFGVGHPDVGPVRIEPTVIASTKGQCNTMKPHSSKVRIIGAAAALCVVAATAMTYSAHSSVRANAAVVEDRLPEVDVAPVIARQVSDWHGYTGRMQAMQHVDVRPLVTGTITAVNFQDGALVKKGMTLFSIDARPYQAEVDRAKAQLQAAEARAAYAAGDAKRANRLVGDNAISKKSLDEKVNGALAAAADVAAARAALEAAAVNLSYTKVTAPIDGRVSRAELTVGNVVATGPSAPLLTTIVSVSPIYASFDVDEQTYLAYLNGAQAEHIPVKLALSDAANTVRTGNVSTIDNELSATSGTIRVRATFDNADGRLLPGLSARVEVGGGASHAALLVAESAIGTDQDKHYVLVVDRSGKVSYREVTTGAPYDGLRSISAGLSAGDQIVVSDTQRAQPGSVVKMHRVSMSSATPQEGGQG
jgi:multidrug efflux system membrane fusion protein